MVRMKKLPSIIKPARIMLVGENASLHHPYLCPSWSCRHHIIIAIVEFFFWNFKCVIEEKINKKK